ncbi:YceI family protein [Telluribacter humicola]
MLLFVMSLTAAIAKPTPVKVNTKASTFHWLAKKVTGEHYGTIGIQDGTLMVDKGKLTGGEFAIEMNTLTNTDGDAPNQRLVSHLKSPDFFDVEKFPVSNFKITKAVPKGGDKYDITGDLTIKGVKQSVTFPAIVKVDAKGNVSAEAKFDVDRTKFGLQYRSGSFFENLGDKMIYDTFTVDVKIVTGTTA